MITHNSLNAAAAPIEDGSLLEEPSHVVTATSPPSNVDLLDQLNGVGDATSAAPASKTVNMLD